MTVSNALSSALSGLLTNQRQADVTAHNIANATTPGYSRRDAKVAAVAADGRGQGVRIEGIRRQVDLLLIRDSRTEQARLDFLTAGADAFARVAEAVGDADAVNGLPRLFQRAEEAFRTLETTPESVPFQRDALRAVQQLAQGFNGLSREFTQIRSDADAAIAREVATVNDSLQQLARINRQIAAQGAAASDIAGLEDQRDRLIDAIARRIPVRVLRTEEPGGIALLTYEGVPLLGQEPATLAFDPRPVVETGQAYNPGGHAGPGFANALSGLRVNGRDIAPGSGDAQSIGGGLLAGLFRVRDEIAPQALARLDALAHAVAERFQAGTTDASLGPADAGLFADAGARLNAADAATTVGLAGRLAVNDAADPAAGGALFRLRDGAAATAPGPAGDAAQVSRFVAAFTAPATYPATSGLGADTLAGAAQTFAQLAHQARTAEGRDAAAQQATFRAVSERRLSHAGVSIDAELQKLALYERSYAANSQVIQAASRMLDELLAIAR